MPKYMTRINVDAIVLVSGNTENEVKEKSVKIVDEFIKSTKKSDTSNIKFEVNRYPSVTELPEETE